MLIDHFVGSAEASIVVTDDTDLSRPIGYLRSQGRRVVVASPRGYRLRRLGAEDHRPVKVGAALLASAQLPVTIDPDNGRKVERPTSWR